MTETEQRYHSNKQEFLALKWAVTEQFHEYLSPYGKNRNEFVVQMDNNPLTYIFSSANLDAAGQRLVAQLTSYNFALEYQCKHLFLCKLLFPVRNVWLFAGFLVPLCPKRALVWGMVVRSLHIEIFVRVLRSSRVNLNNINNTNVFCCV